MDELISRKKALEIIIKHIGVDGDTATLLDVGKAFCEIYTMPARAKIVKCSEGLPALENHITLEDGEVSSLSDWCLAYTQDGCVELGRYIKERGSEGWEIAEWAREDVIGWMEIPSWED